ncbi:hypothetical protein PilKf_00016 [Pillotina sp. SPG140]|jgi:phage shock protein A
MDVFNSADDAKMHIKALITTLKLNEKTINDLNADIAKWEQRVQLARTAGKCELQKQAEAVLADIKAKRDTISAECTALRRQWSELQQRLPTIAAQERTIDTDLLQQELLIVNGYLPGEEEKMEADRHFAAEEKNVSAAAALEALKAKMSVQ